MSRPRHADAPTRLRFRRDLASAGQVGIAALAVVLGGGMSVPTLLVAVALSVWAMLRRLPETPSTTAQRLWTLGVFAALVATIARALLRAEFLDAGVDFLLLLVVQRLFQRQRSREHMQLLMLGALLMVVGAVINADLNYPILLLAYVFVATIALLLNNLVAEGERLGPRVMLELSREGLARSRALIRAAVAVSLMATAGAVLTFLLFPRWGVGAFLRGPMARETRSGFSAEVALGGFGTIKQDATVVMRIEPLGPPQDRPEEVSWHLRGSAFDIYEAGRWRTSRLGETGELAPMLGFAVLSPGGKPLAHRARGMAPAPLLPRPRPGTTEEDPVLYARVTQEDIGADVLFAASEPIAIKIVARGPVESRARVLAGRNREFRVSKLPGPVRYEFISRLADPPPSVLRRAGNPAVEGQYRAYLQRAQSLSKDVTALALEITEGASNRMARVEAVMEYLGGFEYSLQQPQTDRVAAGADPLEGFLFESKAGHCEYFATAMAVLLREVGVPTRVVNGYYGAHYNELGDFYAVRQADAHSWVEVHFGPLGWVTFDPTPPDGRAAGRDAPFWPAASELLDAARNKYLEWVVGFDLSKQLSMLDGLGLRQEGHHRRRIAWGPVLGWMLGIGAAGMVVVWIRRWRRQPATPPATRLWARVLSDLASRGYTPSASESPTAFARRLARDLAPAATEIAAAAQRYEALRFGPSSNEAALETLATAVEAARLAIRSADW